MLAFLFVRSNLSTVLFDLLGVKYGYEVGCFWVFFEI